MLIQPYVVAVPDAVLDDLRDRIRRTRWPDPAPGEAWGQGVDLGYLRGLLSYWADGFESGAHRKGPCLAPHQMVIAVKSPSNDSWPTRAGLEKFVLSRSTTYQIGSVTVRYA